MTNKLSKSPSDWREGRRLRAWELYQKGWKQTRIAEAFGVTRGAVSRWVKQAKAGGEAALRRRIAAGPACRLNLEQLKHLPVLLSQGAEAYGFCGQVWTLTRVAEVIRREFEVVYHPGHVRRILRAIGWTRQKPVRRASQRDEAAIQRWRSEDWPQGEKKP